MYVVTIQTTRGTFREEIDSMTQIEEVLAPYEKDYISFEANQREGKAAPRAKKEIKPMEKPIVKITDFDIDWKKIKSACMTTISKEAGDKEPSDEWKKRLLLAEHSPLRRGCVSWKWENIPTYVSTHFARHHEGCEKFVATQRADRTEVKDRSERSQTDPVMMEMDANIQALINISMKRLCTAADPTTRKCWRAVLEAIREYDENIFWACVPQCVRCGSCPEYTNCGFFDSLTKDWTKEEITNIKTRYDKYNTWRDEAWKLQKIKK